jgi:hypothetical protein
MRSTLPLTLALGSVALAARAQDLPPPVELAWNAPAGCPAREAVLHQTRAMLAGSTTHHLVVARAEVSELAPDHWSVHLATDVDGVAGERSLEANSCASLASATALILAWTVDPAHAPPSEHHESPSVTPTHVDVAPTPTPADHVPVHALLAAGAALDIGTLPSAAGAAEVALGGLVGPVRVEVAGTDWAKQDAVGSTGGTHIHLLEGALRACVAARVGTRLELSPCIGAGVVHAWSDGFGLALNFQRTGDWGFLQSDALAVLTLGGPFALRASAGIVAPLERPPFVVVDLSRGEIPLHRSGVVAGRGAVGIEVHFP